MKEERKKITLDLFEYLTDLIGEYDNKAVVDWKGELIAALDDQELYCHVQFTDFDDTKLNKPKVWWIKSWRSSYTKWQSDKQASELRRREANLVTENSTLLKRKMAELTGIEDKELFNSLARKISAKKLQKIAEVFNTKLDT